MSQRGQTSCQDSTKSLLSLMSSYYKRCLLESESRFVICYLGAFLLNATHRNWLHVATREDIEERTAT